MRFHAAFLPGTCPLRLIPVCGLEWIEQAIVAPRCHPRKRFSPTQAGTIRDSDDDLISLDLQLHFALQSSIFHENLL